MLKAVLLAIAATAVLGLLWAVGEDHRQHCEKQERVSCSVLPWDNGEERRYDGWRIREIAPR